MTIEGLEELHDGSVLCSREMDPGLRTMVAFGGLHQQMGMPPFEFFNLIGTWEINKIFVRDVTRTFYQSGVAGIGDRLSDVSSFLGDVVPDMSRSLFVGTSAGGYAALACGMPIGAAVLAVSPVTVLRRRDRLVMGDRRWRNPMRAAQRAARAHPEQLALRGYLEAQCRGAATVCYPEGSRLDRRHAERLTGLPGVTLQTVASDRHEVIKQMRDDGSLVQLMESLLA